MKVPELKIQILENVAMVERGVKPCSVLSVKSKYIQDIYKLLDDFEVCICFIETEDKNWMQLWIVKDIRLFDIILQLKSKPETNLDHFINGCIFGYSIESILNYIEKQRNNGKKRT